ncbi:MAG: DNA-3-methyladenine glycosylase [Bacteroidales bacterium]
MVKLRSAFYLQEDVLNVARELLGKIIFTQINNEITGGMITETEAYAGTTDRASHAWNHRRTSRTGIMYRAGGVAYVYLCYGIHPLFNFVTAKPEIPHAVLLRGIYPLFGCDAMENRTGKKSTGKSFSDGPGKVTKALGISVSDNGISLTGNRIWVEDHGIVVKDEGVLITPRIGVAYAGSDASLPYRFLIADPGKIYGQKKTS